MSIHNSLGRFIYIYIHTRHSARAMNVMLYCLSLPEHYSSFLSLQVAEHALYTASLTPVADAILLTTCHGCLPSHSLPLHNTVVSPTAAGLASSSQHVSLIIDISLVYSNNLPTAGWNVSGLRWSTKWNTHSAVPHLLILLLLKKFGKSYNRSRNLWPCNTTFISLLA